MTSSHWIKSILTIFKSGNFTKTNLNNIQNSPEDTPVKLTDVYQFSLILCTSSGVVAKLAAGESKELFVAFEHWLFPSFYQVPCDALFSWQFCSS